MFLHLWLKALFIAWGKVKTVLHELDRWIRTTTTLARIVITFPVFVLTFLTWYAFIGIFITTDPRVAAVISGITVLAMHLRVFLLDEPEEKDQDSTFVKNTLDDNKEEEHTTDMYSSGGIYDDE